MKLEMEIPDSFTQEQVNQCKAMVAVQVRRFLEVPLVPPADKVLEYKIKMDEFHVANSIERQFPEVELPSKEVIVEEVVEEVIPK